MNHIVMGGGEIGTAIANIFKAQIHDPNKGEFIKYAEVSPSKKEIEVMHICFPYTSDFVTYVTYYQEEFKPKYTIIHSTVPVGTSTICEAIHSPVIGLHPHLQESLTTFTKFIGGRDASEIANEFRRAGMKVYIFDKSETTELMKIMDTTLYGLCIEYTKDIKEQCKKFNVPFEAWTIYNNNYNTGYEALGFPEYIRPNLVPIMKNIGGHCVRPNLKLLDTKFTKFLDEQGL